MVAAPRPNTARRFSDTVKEGRGKNAILTESEIRFLKYEEQRCLTTTEMTTIIEFLEGKHQIRPDIEPHEMPTPALRKPKTRRRFRERPRAERQMALDMIKAGMKEMEVVKALGIPQGTVHSWKVNGKPFSQIVGKTRDWGWEK